MSAWDFIEDAVNDTVDFVTDAVAWAGDVSTLGLISDNFWDDIKNIDDWEDLLTTGFTWGMYTEYDDLEGDVKDLISSVFPSVDSSAILRLAELNREYMGLETDEQIRRATLEFNDELGYVRSVQSSSGLSANSASYVADRTNRTDSFNNEMDWLRTSLSLRQDINLSETLQQIDILDQQITSQNINTGLNIVDAIF